MCLSDQDDSVDGDRGAASNMTSIESRGEQSCRCRGELVASIVVAEKVRVKVH